MASYIIRRVLLMVPTLLGITLVVFGVMAASPGGVGASLLSAEGNMRPQEREAMREYYNKRFGLGLPWYRQYGRWLNNISPVGSYDATGPPPTPPGVEEVEPPLRWGFEWGVATTAKNPGGDAEPGAEADSAKLAERTGFGFKVPDLGTSFLRKRAVLGLVLDHLPPTLTLNLISIPIIYLIAVTTGIYAGRSQGKWFDVTSGTVFLALWSLPTMWVGVMLLMFLANQDYVHWFPLNGLHDAEAGSMPFFPFYVEGDGWRTGWLVDLMWHLVLPVVCLSYGGFAVLSKLMRASVLENMQTDFVRTARAKGLTEHAILYRHVLRNSVLPLITVASGILPGLLGGAVIVEKIFSIQGMGLLMLDAIRAKDFELVLSTTLVIAAISTVSLLLADLCYAIADPRVSYE